MSPFFPYFFAAQLKLDKKWVLSFVLPSPVAVINLFFLQCSRPLINFYDMMCFYVGVSIFFGLLRLLLVPYLVRKKIVYILYHTSESELCCILWKSVSFCFSFCGRNNSSSCSSFLFLPDFCQFFCQNWFYSIPLTFGCKLDKIELVNLTPFYSLL